MYQSVCQVEFPLEKVSFNWMGLHEINFHTFEVQVSSCTQIIEHKKVFMFLSYLFN